MFLWLLDKITFGTLHMGRWCDQRRDCFNRPITFEILKSRSRANKNSWFSALEKPGNPSNKNEDDDNGSKKYTATKENNNVNNFSNKSFDATSTVKDEKKISLQQLKSYENQYNPMRIVPGFLPTTSVTTETRMNEVEVPSGTSTFSNQKSESRHIDKEKNSAVSNHTSKGSDATKSTTKVEVGIDTASESSTDQMKDIT